MKLGKLVKSNSHTDYVCQIYNSGEIENPPSNQDYAFGSFVKIELETQNTLVGLIYDTVLFNPDFGRLGPRLSPEQDLAIFSPDYINEQAILIGIMVIGSLRDDGNVMQGVPDIAAKNDAMVIKMPEDEIKNFHQANPGIYMDYISVLLSHQSPLAIYLVQKTITKLLTLFPDQYKVLNVLLDDLNWKTQIRQLGGTQ
ncbi:MAG: hypothetical protein H8D23_03840 [Candidatus Brocadiales bacterium]|nr:hypothetical protein [Candidatus Brocadiales bacterium]